MVLFVSILTTPSILFSKWVIRVDGAFSDVALAIQSRTKQLYLGTILYYRLGRVWYQLASIADETQSVHINFVLLSALWPLTIQQVFCAIRTITGTAVGCHFTSLVLTTYSTPLWTSALKTFIQDLVWTSNPITANMLCRQQERERKRGGRGGVGEKIGRNG